MVAAVFKKDTLFFQRLAKASGLYAGNLDGGWGPLTQGAADAWDKIAAATAKTYGTFDASTEENIASLVPKAQRSARQFMLNAKSFPYTIKILSGGRTYAEQNALFAKRPVVTKARAGQSWHNYGIAWDVGIFEGKTYFEGRNAKENKAYTDLAKLILPKMKELEWGGSWKSIVDMPHYQLASGKNIRQAQALLEAGVAYV